jgi:hypothetical protein
MPRSKKPAVPASDDSGSGPSRPGFGPDGPGARNPFTSRGSGGFKSKHPHVIPKEWVRGSKGEDFNLEEKI